MDKLYVALIEGGVVTQVLLAPYLEWPARYVQAGQWVDVSAVTPRPGEGWTYANGVFARPKNA